jgi:ASC-1-like (ASCH) protein
MTVKAGPYSDSFRYIDLDFKSVSQEADRAYVKNFCLNALSPAQRPSTNIIDRMGTDARVKAQIVYLKRDLQNPCGVIVYEETLMPKKNITIHLLCTTDESLYAGKGISRHMLHKMTMLARILPSAMLCASVNPEDSISLRFYERNSFQKDPQQRQTNEVILMKEMKDETPQPVKRPLSDRSISDEPPAKSIRTDIRTAPTERKPLEVTLKQQYLSLIKSGKKTVEGRIASGMFSRVFAGSRIRFFNQTDSVVCRVTKVTKYPSFREMLQGEGVEKCLPGTSTVDAGARIYDAIPGYRERAQQYGVVGIQLQVERS